MRLGIVFAVLSAGALWADCPEGVDNATDADKKFLTDTFLAVRAALPPTPEGWRLEDRNQANYVPPSSFCKGTSKAPLITGYEVRYVWVAGQKELGLKLAELDKREAPLRRAPLAPEKEALVKELGTKDRDLRFQARKIAATDKAAADKMNAEALGYAKQIAEIRAAHFAALKPQMDAFIAERDAIRKATPTELTLYILVNGSGADARDLKAAPAQAASTTTMVGASKTLLQYGGTAPKGASPHKVYGISVQAGGDPKQAEMLLAQMNGPGLKGMIGK